MTVRWGVIGCGDVVRRRVAGALREDPSSRFEAACRRDESERKALCADYQVPLAFADWRELIDCGQIDAVYVATPVNLHCQQTLAAARAGLHVLVEKPMAMSTGECREMVEACEAANVLLGVAYYRRFYPVVERMRTILAAGEIGVPLAVDALTATPNLFRGDEAGAWRVRPEEGGGGALMDIGSHRLNLIVHLFGAPEQVRCVCSTVAADHAAENCATFLARLPQGVHATVRCYFGSPVDPDEFTITGTAGRMVAQPLNSGDLQIETADGIRRESHPPAENFNTPLITDFTDAIRSGRPPRVCGREGLLANEAMERAYADAQRP